MIYTFSETKLIQRIQNQAPLAAALFQDREAVLTPRVGRERIEDVLWKGSLTVYESIAEGIKDAILEWKRNCHECLPRNLSIWISYDSRLFDLNWQHPMRVTVEENGEVMSYHWHSPELKASSGSGIKRASGPIELWFDLLLQPLMGEEFTSIHTYL